MPIPPQFPLKTSCPACGWSMTKKPRSDALSGPSACPRCGNKDLTHEIVPDAFNLRVAISFFKNIFRK